MKETYNVVKPVHPNVPVVGIVSGGVDLNWIEGVLKGVGEGEDKNAGLKYLDAVSVQTYMDPNAPDDVFAKLKGLKTLIKQYNNGNLVPIWVTEFDHRHINLQKASMRRPRPIICRVVLYRD